MIDFIRFKHKKRSSNTINITIVKKQKKKKRNVHRFVTRYQKVQEPFFPCLKISSNSILKIERETRDIFVTNSIQSSLYLEPFITETQVYPTFHLNLQPCARNFIIHVRSNIKIQYANAWDSLRIVIAISSFLLGSLSSFVRSSSLGVLCYRTTLLIHRAGYFKISYFSRS